MSVAAERNALAKVSGRPTLRRREQWNSAFMYTGRWTARVPATQIFIHITVSNPSSYNSNDAHARAVERIGMLRFPNTGGSYNRMIMPNATLYELQPMYRQGAHTVNDHRRPRCNRWGSACPGNGQSLEAPSWNNNVTARAYALAMNVGNTVSDGLVDNLARQIVADYRAGLITWDAAHRPHGHRCLSSKSCPGDRMWAKMGKLHDLIHYHQANGFGEGSSSPRPPTEEDDMPTAKEIADEVYARFTGTVTENMWAAKQDIFSAGREINPRDSGRQSWAYGIANLRLNREQLAELAAVRAEQAGQRQLLVQLASQVSGVPLTTEQIEHLAEGIAAAGQGACDQVLSRLTAVGEALTGEEG